MKSRWEGYVHYYDFTADSVQRVANRDAFRVGLVFVYDDSGASEKEPIGIELWVSAQDLRGGVTFQTAIEAASRILPGLVNHHAPEARGNTVVRSYVYAWNGRLLMAPTPR
jgi:hypothetical protein